MARVTVSPRRATLRIYRGAIPVDTGGGGVQLASTTPAALGSATVGVGTTAARADHVHAMPSAADVGATTAAAAAAAAGVLDTAAIAAHVAAGDPHPAYALESALAAVATSGSASDLGTGTLPIARIADGAVTLAKLADVATATILGRTTAGIGVPEAMTLTQARALLGIPEALVLSSTVADTTGAAVAMGNLSFTPAAGGTYYFKLHGVFRAAAATTGLRFLIDPGNGSGGGAYRTRGSSSTAQASLYGTLDGTSEAPGTSSATTPGNKTGFEGFGILVADATSPTAVSVKFYTEIGGSAVTIDEGDAILEYRRIK